MKKLYLALAASIALIGCKKENCGTAQVAYHIYDYETNEKTGTSYSNPTVLVCGDEYDQHKSFISTDTLWKVNSEGDTTSYWLMFYQCYDRK